MHHLFDAHSVRNAYLEQISARYERLTLPLGPALHSFPLQAVFQPLKLRHAPLAAEDLQTGQSHARLGEEIARDGQAKEPGAEQHAGENSARPSPSVVVHSVAEALAYSPSRRMLILGGPGTGKTTLLKSLLGAEAQQAQNDPDAPLPIFIALPDLARSGATLEYYLSGLVQAFDLEDSWAAILWEAIQQGQAFLCLDSLDEVAPALRPEIIARINGWAQQAGGTWIVGSRFTEYKGGQFAPGQFAEWELQPLEHAARQGLARRLVPVLHHLLSVSESSRMPDPEAVVQAIETHPQATSWGENPLLFSLAVGVQVQHGSLPTSRAALYQQVIEAVLVTREPDDVERAAVLSLMSDLALQLHQAKGRTFALAELLTLLPQITDLAREGDAYSDLAHRLLNTGLFEVIAHETYGFRHQTFQEYLAAVTLAEGLVSQDTTERSNAWNLAWSKRTYSRWTEVLRLLVGVLVRQHGPQGAEVARQWLEALAGQAKTPEGDPGDLGLTLAIRSLSELGGDDTTDQEGELVTLGGSIAATWATLLLKRTHRMAALAEDIRHLRKPLLEQTIALLLANLPELDAIVRATGTKILTLLREAPMEPLLAALDHEDVRAHAVAMKALGRRAPVELLLASLGESEYVLRDAAVCALVAMGADAPIDALLHKLEDPEPLVRNFANLALRYLGSHVPTSALEAAAHQPELRLRALDLLMNQRAPLPLEPLLAALQNPSENVRGHLVDALGRLGEQAPLEPLLVALQDPSPYVRYQALVALGNLGARAPVPLLLTALDDPSTHQAAGIALARLKILAPLEPIVEELHDPEPRVRQTAIQILGELGASAPWDALVSALSDHDPLVRMRAAQALDQYEKQGGTGGPVDALWNSAWSIRSAAAKTLGARGAAVDPAIARRLLEVLGESRPTMRCIAAQLLGFLGAQAPIDLLVQALKDPAVEVRQTAIQVLRWQLSEFAPLEAFVNALDDPDHQVRYQAAGALGSLGERAPRELLIELATGNDFSLRWGAMQALGELGAEAPMDLLVDALQDESDAIRQAAFKAMRDLGEHRPIVPWIAALDQSTPPLDIWLIRGMKYMGAQAPIKALIAGLPDDGAWVRGDTVETLIALAPYTPPEPLLEFLHHPNAGVRQAAVKVLAALGTRVLVEVFVEVLSDPGEEVVLAAVEALGAQSDRAPVEPLVELLAGRSDFIRLAAMTALRKLGERVPEEPLRVALEDQDGEIRIEAARALAKRGVKEAVDLLVAALAQDEFSTLPFAAAEALGDLGERAPVEPLLLALGNTSGDEEHNLCLTAAAALFRTHPEAFLRIAPEAEAVLRGQPARKILGSHAQEYTARMIGTWKQSSPLLLEKLTELLDWHYWQVRLRAAWALGEIRRNIPDRAIRRLLELRHDPESAAVCWEADEALAKILSLETGIEDE